MPRSLRQTLVRRLVGLVLPAVVLSSMALSAPLSATLADAADLPYAPPPPALSGTPYDAPLYRGGGGYRVARVPVRPAPIRYDIYGYPLVPVPPSPLAGGGCPAALAPDYDPDGNFAGYARVPMCR